MVGNGPGRCVVGPLLNSGSAVSWQPQDQEAIRQALGLPATVPCLNAIGRAMADLERHHPTYPCPSRLNWMIGNDCWQPAG